MWHYGDGDKWHDVSGCDCYDTYPLCERSGGATTETAQPTSSPTPTPIIAVEVTSTVAGVTADAFQNTVFVDAFKTTVAAAITGVDADMVTNLRVDGVPVNRRLTDGVEVTYEIVVPAATAAASGYDDVDALSSGVSTSLVAAADTFVETVQNEVEAIAAAAPAGSTEAAEAAAAATHAEAITTVLACLLYTSPSPRDRQKTRMPSSA